MKAGTLKRIRRENVARAKREAAEAVTRKDWRGYILASLKIKAS